MGSVSKVLVCALALVIMWPQAGKAERNKYETALAADIWNSFASRDDLEVFLSTKKNKADKAAIKKFVSALPRTLPLAVLKGDVIQFGADATRWAMDSKSGIWVNNQLYVPNGKSTFSEKVDAFKKWTKSASKTSMWHVWIPTAYAADVDDDTAKAMYASFMDEFGKLMNKECMFSMGGTALQEMPPSKAVSKDAPAKITSVGILCHDQNPAKETIFTAAHGPTVVLQMNGEFAKSKSTDKTFLKKVRIQMNGEDRVKVNFVENAAGSEHHTTEIRSQKGGPFEVLDKNQAKIKAISACTTELAERMIVAIDKVCSSIKASSYVQRGFGQMSGPAPGKGAPAAQEQSQAK